MEGEPGVRVNGDRVPEQVYLTMQAVSGHPEVRSRPVVRVLV